jgi:hypothetical protein
MHVCKCVYVCLPCANVKLKIFTELFKLATIHELEALSVLHSIVCPCPSMFTRAAVGTVSVVKASKDCSKVIVVVQVELAQDSAVKSSALSETI